MQVYLECVGCVPYVAVESCRVQVGRARAC